MLGLWVLMQTFPQWSWENNCGSFSTSLHLISWQTWVIFLKSAVALHTINTHPLLSGPCLSSSSCPREETLAINLRGANELHLTIKRTGNGKFHLQEDQWRWQTPFSQRLVSGMMFRRQSNQSPHTDAEINQSREKERRKKKPRSFSLYCIHWYLFE